MSQVRGCLIIFFTIFYMNVVAFSASATSKPVSPTEPCNGIAVVNSGLHGAIFLSELSATSTTLRRVGYLPTGAAIKLAEPDKDLKTKKNFCRFTYRNVIRGHIQRRQITSVTNIAISTGIDLDSISGFVGAANSDIQKPLIVYKTDQLSQSDIIAKIGRSDFGLVLRLANQDADAAAIKIKYIGSADNPIPVDGYVDREENRALNSDGTFRVYNPTYNESSVIEVKKSGWPDYFSSVFQTKIADVEKITKQASSILHELGDCKVAKEYTLGVTLQAGLGTIFSISGKGEGTIKWTKAKDEVEQMHQFGERSDIRLTIRGLASCNDSPKPAYLKNAHVILGSPQSASQHKKFLFERNEFFGAIAGDPVPANLERTSSRVNLDRELSPFIVVPRKNGEQSAFYYTLFDRIEQYVINNIIEPKSLEISDDDKFALLLMLISVFSYWD